MQYEKEKLCDLSDFDWKEPSRKSTANNIKTSKAMHIKHHTLEGNI